MNKFQLAALSYADLLLLRREVVAALLIKKAEMNPHAEANRRARNRWKRAVARAKEKPAKQYKTPEAIDAYAFNSSAILSPAGIGKIPAENLLHYFPALIAQDWTSVYPDAGGEAKYYVYAHVDARKTVFKSSPAAGGNWGGRPFYIGKGCGNRAYDLKRNQGHGKRIAEILEIGATPDEIVHIAFSGLTESQALAIEAKCIYFFGSIYEPGKRGKRGCLLNLDIPKAPKFAGVMVNPKTGNEESAP